MDYETAAKIVAEHSPNLILSPKVDGQNHIDVRKTEGGAPFSIMLPDSRLADASVSEEDKAAAERKTMTDSLDAAEKHLVG